VSAGLEVFLAESVAGEQDDLIRIVFQIIAGKRSAE
jgi:hypothetical protein